MPPWRHTPAKLRRPACPLLPWAPGGVLLRERAPPDRKPFQVKDSSEVEASTTPPMMGTSAATTGSVGFSPRNSADSSTARRGGQGGPAGTGQPSVPSPKAGAAGRPGTGAGAGGCGAPRWLAPPGNEPTPPSAAALGTASWRVLTRGLARPRLQRPVWAERAAEPGLPSAGGLCQQRGAAPAPENIGSSALMVWVKDTATAPREMLVSMLPSVCTTASGDSVLACRTGGACSTSSSVSRCCTGAAT